MRTLATSPTILVLGAFMASAQDMSPAAIADHVFAKVDTDEDGVLTEAEYNASQLPKFGGSFEAIDDDADGKVTKSEYIAIFTRLHAPGRQA